MMIFFIAYSIMGIEIQIVDNEHKAIIVSAAKEPEKRIKCIPSYKHKEA